MGASPRRIAFCITELDPGGAERALVNIVTRLDRQVWEPKVICLSGSGEMVAPLEAADVPVVCLQAGSGWDLSVIRQLKEGLAAFQPEIVQTFLFHANIAGRVAAWRADVPIVVSGVRVVERDHTKRMWIDRLTDRLVTHHVCVSSGVRQVYERLGIDREKLSVIPNGVDLGQVEAVDAVDLSKFGISNDAKVVLGVGRLHRQKGFDLLIDAMAPLMESQPDLHLLIIGEGPERSALERQRDRETVADRIHLPGRSENVPGLMKSCDIFALSSRWEGMPNVLLEAMAVGVPVVATDVEGVRDVITDPTLGLVVEPHSVSDLQSGLSETLGQIEQVQTMATNAREHVRASFDWDSVSEQYSALWDRLLRERER